MTTDTIHKSTDDRRSVVTEREPYEPAWHWKLYQSSTYSFPSLEAAERFAAGQKGPGRKVSIRHQE